MPDPTPDLESLRRINLFSTLNDRELRALQMALKVRRFQTGETLFQQGDPGDSMVLLVDGLLSVHIRTAAGSMLEVNEILPGQIVGEMSCIDPAPRSATVRAKKPSIVYELSRPMLKVLQVKGPAIAVSIVGSIIGQVTWRLRDADKQIEEELSDKAPSRSTTAPPPATGRVTRAKLYTGRVSLSHIPGLDSLAEDVLDTLRELAPPMVYPAGAELCREGEIGSSCFMIVQGKLEVHKAIDGGSRCLATLGPGALVGQMALVDRSPRSATVKAVEEAVVLELGRREFQSLLANNHPVGINFQEQVAIAGIRQLRMADSRLATVLGSIQRSLGRTGQAPVAGFRAALKEWGISMADLDKIEVVRPDGIMTSAEIRARSGKR